MWFSHLLSAEASVVAKELSSSVAMRSIEKRSMPAWQMQARCRRDVGEISRLYLAYISPTSRLHLPYISRLGGGRPSPRARRRPG